MCARVRRFTGLPVTENQVLHTAYSLSGTEHTTATYVVRKGSFGEPLRLLFRGTIRVA